MTADPLLDVFCEFDPEMLARQKDPTQTVAEVVRAAAEELAAQSGHRLRHPEPAEMLVRSMLSPTTGVEVLGVSTRWRVDR